MVFQPLVKPAGRRRAPSVRQGAVAHRAGPAHFPAARGGWTHEPAGPEAESCLRRTQLSGRLPASPQSLAMSCYIYQLPSWVLDDLCRNMDTLSEWDWMQFGEWSFLRPH